MEYQESFRLPNNNVGSQGGREEGKKDERQTITLRKPLVVNVQPPYIFSSGRLLNFFPFAKRMAEIESLATCESFLSLPSQVCRGV